MKTDDELNEFREALLCTLLPRQHWTTDYAHLSQEFDLLVQLGVFGLLSLHSQHAILHTLPRYLSSQSDAEHEPEMESPARARRGSDLPDLTWSAFKLLRSTHPSATFQIFSGYLPFGWLHDKTGTFVTAGNTELSRWLPFISHHNIVRLGILDYHHAAVPSDAERKKYERHERAREKAPGDAKYFSSLWMNWIVLQPRALQALQHIFNGR